MDYQAFPQPGQQKETDEKFTIGMNKSKRSWKVGANRVPNRNWRNRGATLSWDEKMKLKKEKDAVRNQIKEFKESKVQKRKQNKEKTKQRKRQRELNEIKSGKFQVIKNPKAIRKWNKKMKKQLVKLPAEVFETLCAPK